MLLAFRMPRTGAVPGGTRGTPFAHRCVLFVDEMPELNPYVIEVLRQSLEDRVTGTLAFPANFTLIGVMNPCPCGYYGDARKECTCTSSATRYQKKLSGPLLDRIDIHVEVPRVEYEKLGDNRIYTRSAHCVMMGHGTQRATASRDAHACRGCQLRHDWPGVSNRPVGGRHLVRPARLDRRRPARHSRARGTRARDGGCA